MAESRASLRAALRARRDSLDGAARFNAARAVAEHLASIPEFVAARRVAGYWAVAGEVPLSAVVAVVDRNPAQAFFLPMIPAVARGPLAFAAWRVGDPVVPNRFGIPEPEDATAVATTSLDVVLLPVVGFDRRGHRLGTGGGYYDRTFAFRQKAPGPPLLIGIAYACQEADDFEPATWDVDLDWVVTERESIECARVRIAGG